MDLPSDDQLQELSVRLQRLFQPRYELQNIDLSTGRVRSLISRGIGIEVDGASWKSFHAARWRPFRWRWVVIQDIGALEASIRAFLEAELRTRSFAAE